MVVETAEQVTQVVDESVEAIVSDVVGEVPTVMEDDSQLDVPVEPQDDQAEIQTEEGEVKPDATVAPDDPNAQLDTQLRETGERKHTPQEEALYARMHKYKNRAQGAEGELQELRTRVAALETKPDGEKTDSEVVNPNADLDKLDFVTVENLDSFGDYLVNQIELKRQEGVQQAQKAQADYLDEANTAGYAIYDDWEDTMKPVIATMEKDPEIAQQIMRAGNPARAARVTYEIAKNLAANGASNATAPVAVNTAVHTPNRPVVVNNQPSNNTPANPVNLETLTPVQRDLVIDAISRCQSDEQINELTRRLGIKT